jgi:hypothetical protein
MLALLNEILALLGQILGIVQALYSGSKTVAVEHIPYQIESTVVATSLNVANPIYGLAALQSQMASFETDVDGRLTTISSEIAALQQQVSSLPVPPSTSDIATGVWSTNIADVPGSYLQVAGPMLYQWFRATAYEWSSTLRTCAFAPIIGVRAYNGFNGWSAFPSPDVADWSTIQPTDTLLSWLNRESQFSPWSYLNIYGDANPNAYCHFVDGPNNYELVTLINETQFSQLKAVLFPPSATADIPPVWPGIANVTLGASQQLAMGVTVPGPLDGVIVAITSVPTWKGFFTFDNVRSYRNVGAVTFVTDNGDEELPQTLGFETAVYTPKAMVRASAAKLRTETGVQGTVTPWLRSV